MLEHDDKRRSQCVLRNVDVEVVLRCLSKILSAKESQNATETPHTADLSDSLSSSPFKVLIATFKLDNLGDVFNHTLNPTLYL